MNLFIKEQINYQRSVVYVDVDAHNRNRTTLETLLPRESNSKNTSAALLPTIGFPAFAIHDNILINNAISKCTRRLEGKYGFKRYLRDGTNHQLEDPIKPFYDSSEVKVLLILIRIITKFVK